MRIVLSLLLLLSGWGLMAQDEYTPDYRKKNDNFTKVREKDVRGEIATFAIAGIDERFGKEPLTNVLPPVDYGSDHIKFEGNNIQVIIRSESFDPDKHKLFYYDEKYLLKIDNKPYFGSYYEVPDKKIASVTAIIGKDTVRVPEIALFDLYSPVYTYRDGSGTIRTHNRVVLSPDNRTIYIYMLNKEVKGNYEVTWVIRDKQYMRRVVDTGLLQ